MQTPDIDREIRTFLINNFLFGRADALREDGSLLGDVIDSTGVLDLISFLQDRFDINVDDEDVVPDNLDSVKNLVAYVGKKLQEKA